MFAVQKSPSFLDFLRSKSLHEEIAQNKCQFVAYMLMAVYSVFWWAVVAPTL